jgi:hypothetical protein
MESRHGGTAARSAECVLAREEDLENQAVGQQLGVHPQTVGKCAAGFWRSGRRVCATNRGPGAPRTIEDKWIEAVITRTVDSKPEAATRWSTRGMARDSGLSVGTV